MAVTIAAEETRGERFGATIARLLRLSWPIVLARIGIQTMGLVDAVAVGRFSARELGYHAMGWAPTAVAAMWVANGVNLLLNILFVPGTLGLPAGGAVGAGWATLGARTMLLVWLAVYVWRMRDARRLGVFTRPAAEPEAAREQRRIGYGAGTSYFVEAGAFVGMNVVAGWLGALAIAAWAVVLNISALIFMIPLGIAGATAVLVGASYGAGDRRGMLRAAQAGFIVSAAIAFAITLGVALFSRLIVSAYATDGALLTLSATTLLLVSPFLVPDALQVVAAQALRAQGDVLWPTITHTASYAVVMLPLGWALAHPLRMGLTGCAVSIIIASFLAAGLLLARLARLTRGGR